MSPRVQFTTAPQPPSYSPPPAYAAHNFDGMMTFAQKERMASIAENKLTYLVSQKRREPSLRQVLLHAGFLERVLDSIDATTPEEIVAEPMVEEQAVTEENPAPAYEIHKSLSTIVEVDEMDIDEEDEDEADEDEDMPALTRTVSHRPGSPVSSDDEEEDSDSDEELPSPPPVYTAAADHPLFDLFNAREKARREELSNQYRIEHEPQENAFLNNTLAVAA